MCALVHLTLLLTCPSLVLLQPNSQGSGNVQNPGKNFPPPSVAPKPRFSTQVSTTNKRGLQNKTGTAGKSSKGGVSGPCSSNPCGDGTCIEKSSSFKCKCTAGKHPDFACTKCSDVRFHVFGDHCQHVWRFCDGNYTIDDVTGCSRCMKGYRHSSKERDCAYLDCKYNPCKHGGICSKRGCLCPVSTTGLVCENEVNVANLKKCKKNICKNQGTCYLSYNRKTTVDNRNKEVMTRKNPKQVCLCPKQFAGNLCERRCVEGAQSCSHGKCQKVKGNRYFCRCHDGWEGDQCDQVCSGIFIGRFGPACGFECGHCQVQPCDHVTGECHLGKCLDGYTGVACLTPGGANVTHVALFGSYSLNGRFVPAFKDFRSQLAWEFVERNRQYVKRSARSSFRPGKRRREALRAEINSLTPGSVVVEYSLYLPDGLDLGPNPEESLIQGLKNNAKFFNGTGGYTVNLASITARVDLSTVTPANSRQEEGGGGAIIFMAVVGCTILAGAIVAVMCLVKHKQWPRSTKKASLRRGFKSGSRVSSDKPAMALSKSQVKDV